MASTYSTYVTGKTLIQWRRARDHGGSNPKLFFKNTWRALASLAFLNNIASNNIDSYRRDSGYMFIAQTPIYNFFQILHYWNNFDGYIPVTMRDSPRKCGRTKVNAPSFFASSGCFLENTDYCQIQMDTEVSPVI